MKTFEKVTPLRLPAAALGAEPQCPVRIHTLGRFTLCCDGRVLAFHGKAPRKALELLQLLIAHGGREVQTAVLMRDLWQDDPAEDCRNMFDNTLHRLCRILEHPEVLSLQSGKLTLNPELCWVDAWTFARVSAAFIDRSCELSGAACAPNCAPPLQDAEAALRLYSGHFLQHEADVPWVCLYRDRMQSRFQRLVKALGTLQEQAGNWEAAAEVYVRGLEIDNLSEVFYQRLMLCHQKLGQHAEALRIYRRCRELLSIVLAIPPSVITERLRAASATATP